MASFRTTKVYTPHLSFPVTCRSIRTTNFSEKELNIFPQSLGRVSLNIKQQKSPFNTQIRARHSSAPPESPNAVSDEITLYPSISSYENGYLQVSSRHRIYYRLYGNPEGAPALFLHGGPGAGCFDRHARFFDPSHYKIVLFDQRGCGASEPKGCLLENTTWDLVDDIEKLKVHLGVKKWGVILGGSWGATLALAYAQTHPASVAALILRGLCLLRQQDIDWFYRQGAASIFPFAWEALIRLVDPHERSDLVASFYRRLTSADAAIRDAAASAWLTWEMSLSSFSISSSLLSWDGSQYTAESQSETNVVNIPFLAKEKGSTRQNPPSIASSDCTGPAMELPRGAPSTTVQSRLECHYFYHKGFLREGQLLDDVDKIRNVRCLMVHGRFDFVCPVKNAFDLHSVWPEAQLRIVPDAGHSMYEKGITRELILATRSLMEASKQ